MRRIATVVLILLLVLFGAYTALWFYIANRMSDEIAQWAARERQNRLDVSWESLRVGGYPLEFRIAANGLQVRDLTPGRAVEIRVKLMQASAYPWNFRSWEIEAPSGLTAVAGPAASPSATLTADTATGDIVLGAEHDIAGSGIRRQRRARRGRRSGDGGQPGWGLDLPGAEIPRIGARLHQLYPDLDGAPGRQIADLQPVRRDAEFERIAADPQALPRDIEPILTLARGPLRDLVAHAVGDVEPQRGIGAEQDEKQNQNNRRDPAHAPL